MLDYVDFEKCHFLMMELHILQHLVVIFTMSIILKYKVPAQETVFSHFTFYNLLYFCVWGLVHQAFMCFMDQGPIIFFIKEMIRSVIYEVSVSLNFHGLLPATNAKYWYWPCMIFLAETSLFDILDYVHFENYHLLMLALYILNASPFRKK